MTSLIDKIQTVLGAKIDDPKQAEHHWNKFVEHYKKTGGKKTPKQSDIIGKSGRPLYEKMSSYRKHFGVDDHPGKRHLHLWAAHHNRKLVRK